MGPRLRLGPQRKSRERKREPKDTKLISKIGVALMRRSDPFNEPEASP